MKFPTELRNDQVDRAARDLEQIRESPRGGEEKRIRESRICLAGVSMIYTRRF